MSDKKTQLWNVLEHGQKHVSADKKAAFSAAVKRMQSAGLTKLDNLTVTQFDVDEANQKVNYSFEYGGTTYYGQGKSYNEFFEDTTNLMDAYLLAEGRNH